MEDEIRKYGDAAFGLLLFLGLVPFFLYEMEFNAPFILAFKYLSIPIICITFLFSFKFLSGWHKEVGATKALLFTAMTAGLNVLISSGYVMSYNVFIGDQKSVIIEGTVINKGTSAGKNYSYYFTINDNSDKNIVVTTSQIEYEKIIIGNHYSDSWTIGSLDLIYRNK